MLPTINLQLTELTQFDTSKGGFAPDAAAEPTAMFADVLAVKGDIQPENGELLPQGGNGLPLLPESLTADPELTADLVLDAEGSVAPLPEDALPLMDGELAPISIVDTPEPVAVMLDLEPVPAPGDEISIVEDPPILREMLPIEGLVGKDGQPATPPGPVEPGERGEVPNLRPLADVPAALQREAAPQTGSDAALRPILAAAAPRNAVTPEVAPPRVDTIDRSAAVSSTAFDAAAARAAEPRIPVPADSAAVTPETLKPLPESVGQTTQPVTQATQTSALNANGLAEGMADVRAASDAAPLTRTPTAESLAPRQLQALTQPIDTPVQQPDWDRAVSERVVMMANNKLQQAEIRLTPAELGPLRVQVTVDDGAANVSFQAQHAMTREAIEQALPRLRELFAEQGLSLGQTSVGHEGASAEDDARASGLEGSSGEGGDALVDEAEVEVVRTRVESGLVDTFV